MLKFKPKKLREDDSIVEVGDVKLDAAETEVVFADEEKDIQVVVSPDPENENSVTVAVLTNSKEDVEEEEVLGSASVEGSEDTAAAEESVRLSVSVLNPDVPQRPCPPVTRLASRLSANVLKLAVLPRRPKPRRLLPTRPMPVRTASQKPVRSSVPKSAKKPNPKETTL